MFFTKIVPIGKENSGPLIIRVAIVKCCLSCYATTTACFSPEPLHLHSRYLETVWQILAIFVFKIRVLLEASKEGKVLLVLHAKDPTTL